MPVRAGGRLGSPYAREGRSGSRKAGMPVRDGTGIGMGGMWKR